LRLVRQEHVDWSNRAQVIGVAARMMRRVLLNYAKSREAIKRGGLLARTEMDNALRVAAAPDPGIEFLDLNRALEKLETVDAQMAAIVECRFLGGLTLAEISELSGLSTATLQREWAVARLWLLRRIQRDPEP
jgi:RNA polymerase sigma factor (TIGR02999 family)